MSQPRVPCGCPADCQVLDSLGKPSRGLGVRWRARPGSSRDIHRKTLSVRHSGANSNCIFSVAEGQVEQGKKVYVVLHATVVVDEGDELARRFIIRASAREALEEHVAAETVRRAAAARSRPMKTLEPSTICFLHRHHPGKRTETAMRGRYLGPTALIGPHGRSSWWVRFGGGHTCALLSTCEESHRTKRIAWASMQGDSWMSCSGPPPVEVPTDHQGNPKSRHAMTWTSARTQ